MTGAVTCGGAIWLQNMGGYGMYGRCAMGIDWDESVIGCAVMCCTSCRKEETSDWSAEMVVAVSADDTVLILGVCGVTLGGQSMFCCCRNSFFNSTMNS